MARQSSLKLMKSGATGEGPSRLLWPRLLLSVRMPRSRSSRTARGTSIASPHSAGSTLRAKLKRLSGGDLRKEAVASSSCSVGGVRHTCGSTVMGPHTESANCEESGHACWKKSNS